MTTFTYFKNCDWANAQSGLCGEDLKVREELSHCAELIANTPKTHPIFNTWHEAFDMISKIMAENEDVIAAEIGKRRAGKFAVYFRKTPVGQTNREFCDRIMENKHKNISADLFVKVVTDLI